MSADEVLQWKKSSFSQTNSNCVEVAPTADGGFVVRNSKRPDEAQVSFTRQEWEAFLAGAKQDEFDPGSW